MVISNSSASRDGRRVEVKATDAVEGGSLVLLLHELADWAPIQRHWLLVLSSCELSVIFSRVLVFNKS